MAGYKTAKKKGIDVIPKGTHVTWHYRSAIGHGVTVGIAKLGKDRDSTKYRIKERDHHVSDTGSKEPAVVEHYGSALTVVH